MHQPLNRCTLGICVLIVCTIMTIASIVLPLQEAHTRPSSSVVCAFDLLPVHEEIDGNYDVEFKHCDDWEEISGLKNLHIEDYRFSNYNQSDREAFDQVMAEYSQFADELLEHGIIDSATIHWSRENAWGGFIDAGQAEIYAFNTTEGAEWYFGQQRQTACLDGPCRRCVEGLGDEAVAPGSHQGGSVNYLVRVSNVVVSTSSFEDAMAREVAEKIVRRAEELERAPGAAS